MGWSCTKEQSIALERIRQWELSQPGYELSTPGAVFFESPENGKDYGSSPFVNMEIEVYEFVNNGQAYKRGYLEIEPDGRILKRTQLELRGLEVHNK